MNIVDASCDTCEKEIRWVIGMPRRCRNCSQSKQADNKGCSISKNEFQPEHQTATGESLPASPNRS
jgi:hypothetical protein